MGSAVGGALETFAVPYTVIERDPDVAKELRARGIPCLFGDAGYRDILTRAGAREARLAIVALPEIEPARRAVRTLHALNPDLPILARAHGRAEADDLWRHGATEVIQPEVEGAATLIRHALKTLRLPKDLAVAYLERFREAMQTARPTPTSGAGALPEVREVTITEGGVTDQSLREARIRERFGVTVVAISRGDGVILNPPPETILRTGDRVRVFGLPEQIEAFATAPAK